MLAAGGDPPPAEAIDAAVEVLRAGQVVGIPTDTVYGLAADPFNPDAVDRVFRAKGRPTSVELPVLVADAHQLEALVASVPEAARRVAARFWPGALTLVLPRRPGLAMHLGTNQATVGVRCPAHPVPLAICRRVGPIATTSANRHGASPFTNPSALLEGLGTAVDLVLDAGRCAGQPSTVVDLSGPEPRLLRPGAVSWADVGAAVDSGA